MSASSTSCACAMTGRRSRGPLARDDVLDRVQRLTRRGVADRVDVDLRSPSSSTACAAARQVVPHLHAVVVQRAAVRRQQRAGLVLDHTVGEELHGLRGQQRRAELLDAATRIGELVELGGRSAEGRRRAPRLNRDRPARPDGPRRGRCRRRPAPPRRPAPRSRRAPGSSRRPSAERADPHLGVACGMYGVDQVDRAPLAQRAEHRAVLAARDLAEHGVRACRR